MEPLQTLGFKTRLKYLFILTIICYKCSKAVYCLWFINFIDTSVFSLLSAYQAGMCVYVCTYVCVCVCVCVCLELLFPHSDMLVEYLLLKNTNVFRNLSLYKSALYVGPWLKLYLNIPWQWLHAKLKMLAFK